MKRVTSSKSGKSPLKTKLLKEQLEVPLAGASFARVTWRWPV
jgi:hypothetical protein